MAEPIPLDVTPRDPRSELRARLETAPLEHAEALLAGYEILQGLHDQGALDLLRGAIDSRDKLLQIFVDATKSPEAIRTIRNVVILGKALASVDPELLGAMTKALPEALGQTRGEEPLGLLQLLKKLNNPDSRRALTTLTYALESTGKALINRAT